MGTEVDGSVGVVVTSAVVTVVDVVDVALRTGAVVVVVLVGTVRAISSWGLSSDGRLSVTCWPTSVTACQATTMATMVPVTHVARRSSGRRTTATVVASHRSLR